MFSLLYSKIESIATISTKTVESWGSLVFEGQFQSRYSKTVFTELYGAFEKIGKAGSISFQIWNSPIQYDELLDSLVDEAQWSVNINKQSFMGAGDEITNFFYGLDAFSQWAQKTDPFSVNNPFNNHKCRIEVNGLQSTFGGQNFFVSGDIQGFLTSGLSSYDHDRIKSIIRQFSEPQRVVQPEKHYVSFGDVDNFSLPFYRNSLMCLSVALCDELYENKVVLRGIRRLEFSLQPPTYETDKIKEFQESLKDAFCWIYSDNDSRYELRHKLMVDRLTLDLSLGQSYYESVVSLISEAFRQAKERYNYALLERSSEYQKELQVFLKELHGLCDSYSAKVRSLLGGFLRDALAGFLTVAITVIARVGDFDKPDSDRFLAYIFCAYGIYLLVSCVFQVIVDWIDLFLSEKEINYWKTASREYMSKKDFEIHKENTVIKRRNRAILQYVIIALLYVALAVFCFKLPRLWGKLEPSTEKIEFTNNPKNADIETADIELIDTTVIDKTQDGDDLLSGDHDTTLYHTPGREQE